jgi:chlorobactene glucosyltransferase
LPDIPFVTVIIPARNEESNIEKCVLSLLHQSYPPEKYKIIVVDDNSSDETASIVKRIGENHGNLLLIPAGNLPEGWAGKNNACWQGTKKAEGDWYCFVDADTASEPELLINAISFSEQKKLDLLSINPFQELSTFTERVFLPGVFLAIAATMNFNRVNDPEKPESGANGQFMLFRKTTYDSIGGHRAVRSEIMEDMAFAELVKKSGFRLYWIFGDKLIRTRMYRNISHIWEGLSKNMVDITKDSNRTTTLYRAFSSFVLGWMPLALPLYVFCTYDMEGASTINHWAVALSFLASISFLTFFSMTLHALNVPLKYVISFPFGFSLHSFLTINSRRKLIKGQRRWKGRTYG